MRLRRLLVLLVALQLGGVAAAQTRANRRARPLFISYTGLLGLVQRDVVKSRHLARGLFYFGATRAYLMGETVPEEVSWFYQDAAQGRRAHARIQRAVARAERDGRVVWRPLGEPSSLAHLNALFRANRIPALELDRLESYSYPGVAQAVAEQGLRLNVLWQ